MASNKHNDFKKIENFVRSKCYSEDILKDKRKLISQNLVIDLAKSWEKTMIFAREKTMIFDNDRKRIM